MRKIIPEKERQITIKNDAWLGADVIFLQGVTIGDYAIVGAGAVVTKDIPPYSTLVFEMMLKDITKYEAK